MQNCKTGDKRAKSEKNIVEKNIFKLFLFSLSFKY